MSQRERVRGREKEGGKKETKESKTEGGRRKG